MIAHNSSRCGGVSVEPLSIFSGGRVVRAQSLKNTRSAQSVQDSVNRLKKKRYNALAYNCEHFVNEVLGLRVESPQLALWGVLLLAGGITCIVASKR